MPAFMLVGHSFAGLEMPLVAARMKDRIAGIVFLDAVYDHPTTDHKEINRLLAPPDSALQSREALEKWSRQLIPQIAGPVQTALLQSQTYVGLNGRIFWQLPAQAGEKLSETVLKGTEYAGIRSPVLVIWANSTGTWAGGMKSLGYPASDIEFMRKWESTTDVENKQRGIAVLKSAVPNVSIVEMAGPHALHGYSMGGLFAFYVLFERPKLFREYLIGAPGLWWDREAGWRIEQKFAQAHVQLPARVFLTVGSLDESEANNSTAHLYRKPRHQGLIHWQGCHRPGRHSSRSSTL